MTPFLRLTGLTRRFSGGAGVDDLSLSLGRGEILALLGPSGSGKTTTLRLLAGFEIPDRGRIEVEDEDLTLTPPARRRFGMVFQHYALFPHLPVGENVGFGLVERGVPRADRAGIVARALGAVDLEGYQPRAVGSLSGGQQQRVALARALAPEPRVLLLDEPLSNLDPALRERTRRELRQLIERIGITTVLVTHEQEEAFDLADRVAILNAGRLDQLGTPEELYLRPATPFVASFIGRATLFEAEALDGELRLGAQVPPLALAADGIGGPVVAAIRPEAFRLTAAGTGWAAARVLERRFTGAISFYRLGLGAGNPVIEVAGEPTVAAVGDLIGIEPTGRGITLFPRPA
jgi:ABC-type Fe3+/spermidine/putrescine transport system ATPase subunit